MCNAHIKFPNPTYCAIKVLAAFYKVIKLKFLITDLNRNLKQQDSKKKIKHNKKRETLTWP
jgi:hypothetical protein